jgi:hypothetical protein
MAVQVQVQVLHHALSRRRRTGDEAQERREDVVQLFLLCWRLLRVK